MCHQRALSDAQLADFGAVGRLLMALTVRQSQSVDTEEALGQRLQIFRQQRCAAAQKITG
ncbi:hypothetical protein DBV14_07260 [Variovorax sp. KBW07]|jgi:hypothetical protein|nr:hypothetical protein DBV14_07260 [Variovorax sp. KBW07]